MSATLTEIALLALAYHELWRNRHTGPEWLLEDLECARGELSLLGKIAAHDAEPSDWALLRVMVEQPESLPAVALVLSERDPVRAAALLHAGRPTRRRPARTGRCPSAPTVGTPSRQRCSGSGSRV